MRTEGSAISIGTHRLAFDRLGAGVPAVILDAAGGSSSTDWGELPTELATLSTVVLYDRAGLGRSDPGPLPRTSARLVAELRVLLAALALDPPYVLTGRSLGGLNMLLFARQHPAEVAGLLLIDPWPDALYASFPATIREKWDANGLRLPPGPVRDEFVATPMSEADAAQTGANPDVLAVVLIRDHKRGLQQWRRYGFTESEATWIEESWQTSLQHLAASFPRGRAIVVERAGHSLHRERPDLVVEYLTRLVQSARASGAR